MKNGAAASPKVSRVLALVDVLKQPALLKSRLAERGITLENPGRLSEKRGTREHDFYCHLQLLEHIHISFTSKVPHG